MTNDAQTGLPDELFTTIDHVGIAVPDLDEAIAFYARAFGVQSVHEETNEEQGVREAMLAVGDGETRIQLLAPLTPESTIAKFIGRSGPGLQQLAFRVEDVEAVSATLRERGAAPALRRPQARHRRQPGQLRPPQGRRRRARRAGPAGRHRALIHGLAGNSYRTGNIPRPQPSEPTKTRETRERDQGRHPRRPAGRRGAG